MFSFTFSQGSNNSDQSSGYLSGSGGSNSLPANANPTVDTGNPFDFKYGPTRLDNLNDKFQGQQRNDIQNMKKLSLTSSIGDYCSSSNNEQDMEFGNGHKWVILNPWKEFDSTRRKFHNKRSKNSSRYAKIAKLFFVPS